MNSFRPLVYLPDGVNVTRVFCRDSGLVQGLLSPGIQRCARLKPSLRVTRDTPGARIRKAKTSVDARRLIRPISARSIVAAR
jgi:hypothetical protein